MDKEVLDKKVLGKKVKDVVTGFEGIAVGVAHYLNGCTRVCIQPRGLKDKDGGTVDSEWVDDVQIKVLRSGGVLQGEDEKKKRDVGGPQKDPGCSKKSA